MSVNLGAGDPRRPLFKIARVFWKASQNFKWHFHAKATVPRAIKGSLGCCDKFKTTTKVIKFLPIVIDKLKLDKNLILPTVFMKMSKDFFQRQWEDSFTGSSNYVFQLKTVYDSWQLFVSDSLARFSRKFISSWVSLFLTFCHTFIIRLI